MMIFSRFNFNLTKWFSRGKRVNEPKFSKARICIIGEPSRCGIAKLHLFERPPRIRGEDAPGGRAICIVARRCSPLLNFFRKFPNVPSNNLILLVKLAYVTYIKSFSISSLLFLVSSTLFNGWNTIRTCRIFPIFSNQLRWYSFPLFLSLKNSRRRYR